MYIKLVTEERTLGPVRWDKSYEGARNLVKELFGKEINDSAGTEEERKQIVEYALTELAEKGFVEVFGELDDETQVSFKVELVPAVWLLQKGHSSSDGYEWIIQHQSIFSSEDKAKAAKEERAQKDFQLRREELRDLIAHWDESDKSYAAQRLRDLKHSLEYSELEDFQVLYTVEEFPIL